MELNSKGLYLSLKKELEIVVLCSRRHQNVKLGFSRGGLATTAKKCTKQRYARAHFFGANQPIAFYRSRSRCRCRRRLR